MTEDEHTVKVDRPQAGAADPADHTLVVRRARPKPAADDATLAVARKPSLLEERVAGRRRGIAPPPAPVLPESAIEAVGPGAVDVYWPRPVPPAPVAPTPTDDEPRERTDGRAIPSVNLRGQRGARLVLALFAVACVASLGGLALLASLIV
ncbi:hypothetical protein RN607_12045 [Demequina capsici]|uniref:Uncharacterized protein n=1 Tax=Demequina capsici TaxID=3075620 RepID=A0AA96JFK1_9MICO|nr:hypothetical protein [Demequina sp. PMTSA13]WNM26924.1 hypothetical protein RN607_12045 [Demequina sp. PMTSA13]